MRSIAATACGEEETGCVASPPVHRWEVLDVSAFGAGRGGAVKARALSQQRLDSGNGWAAGDRSLEKILFGSEHFIDFARTLGRSPMQLVSPNSLVEISWNDEVTVIEQEQLVAEETRYRRVGGSSTHQPSDRSDQISSRNRTCLANESEDESLM